MPGPIPEDARDRVLAGSTLLSPLGLWAVKLGENDNPFWTPRPVSEEVELALAAYELVKKVSWELEITIYGNGTVGVTVFADTAHNAVGIVAVAELLCRAILSVLEASL